MAVPHVFAECALTYGRFMTMITGVCSYSAFWISGHCFARSESLSVVVNLTTIFWIAGSFQLEKNPFNPLLGSARNDAYSSGTVTSLVYDGNGNVMSYFIARNLLVVVAGSSSASLTLIPIAPSSCCISSTSC